MSKKGTIWIYNDNSKNGTIKLGQDTFNFKLSGFNKEAFDKKNDEKLLKSGTQVEFDIEERKEGKGKKKYAVNIKLITKEQPEQPNKPTEAEKKPNQDDTERHYYLPKDSHKLVIKDNNVISDVDNFNLRHNKLAYYEKVANEDKKGKFIFFKRDKDKIVLKPTPKFDKLLIDAISKRYQNAIGGLQGVEIKSLESSPSWRLITGIGNESVYETSITLHHLYGMPYIPGQSVKGVVRSHIILELFGNSDIVGKDVANSNKAAQKNTLDAEKKALENELFVKIFGGVTQEKSTNEQERSKSTKGLINFYDALPSKEPVIEVDIMTPHYGDYYQGTDSSPAPADYLKPNPIPFLTVGKSSKFNFIIGIRKKDNHEIEKATFPDFFKFPDKTKITLLEIAYEWLKSALSDHGIGAKTAVGYGYMNNRVQCG